MDPMTLFYIAALVMSVVLHEVAHGWMANYLGDPTARYAGRLTLNPISHIDPFGSVILPAILVLSSSPFLIGWAKPVPYNPHNLRRGGRWGEALVAGAGPATNFAIALFCALLIRLSFPGSELLLQIVLMNIMLAIFNLIPIPPLDGSKILSDILPRPLQQSYDQFRVQLESNPFLGFGIVIVFVMLFGSVLSKVVYTVAQLFVGGYY